MITAKIASARLYGCSFGGYSIVVATADRGTADLAFRAFMQERKLALQEHQHPNIKTAKTLGNRPLYIVDRIEQVQA